MRRALWLLACTALCWGAVAGVARASCASEAEIQRDAIADFDVHVVEMRRLQGTVRVDAVRRGAVKVGEAIAVDISPTGSSTSRQLAKGERYRMLPRTRARPIQVTVCNAWLLPGRIRVHTPVDEAGGLGAVGVAGVLAGFCGVLAFVLIQRRRDAR